jgi:hypothetical protein
MSKTPQGSRRDSTLRGEFEIAAIGSQLSRLLSPGPTPIVNDADGTGAQAHDSVQVHSLGASLWVVMSDNDCALAVHGVDLRMVAPT